MQHILRGGFYKIRYYGIMSLASIKIKMEDCFRLLKATGSFPFPFYEGLYTYEILEEILDRDPFRCSCCDSGKMVYDLAEGKSKEP